MDKLLQKPENFSTFVILYTSFISYKHLLFKKVKRLKTWVSSYLPRNSIVSQAHMSEMLVLMRTLTLQPNEVQRGKRHKRYSSLPYPFPVYLLF